MEIYYVDGTRAVRQWSVRVLPGAHAFRIGHSVRTGIIVFNVQAGGAYQFNAEGQGDEFVVWVTDKATGETVAGKTPPVETTRHEAKVLPEEHISHVSTSGTAGGILLPPLIPIPVGGKGTYILAVNNEHLGEHVDEVELLPGRYSFRIRYEELDDLWIIGFGFLDLDVKAGRSYRIEISPYSIWATDQASGEVVAGLKLH